MAERECLAEVVWGRAGMAREGGSEDFEFDGRERYDERKEWY